MIVYNNIIYINTICLWYADLILNTVNPYNIHECHISICSLHESYIHRHNNENYSQSLDKFTKRLTYFSSPF